MKTLRKNRWTMIHAACLLVTIVLGTGFNADAGVSIPNTFSPSTTISSSQMNANFTAVANQMPAVKQSLPEIWIVMSTTASQLSSIAFTAPGTGYAMIFATGSIAINTLASTSGVACVDLDATSGYIEGCTPKVGSDTAVRAMWPATFPDMLEYSVPYSIIKVIPVTSGAAYSYYLNGYYAGAAGASLFQSTMTVLFVPNALP